MRRQRKRAGSDNTLNTWIEEQYRSTLIGISVLIVIFHPAFHYILEIIPGIPPDSLRVRFVSVGVAIALLALVTIYPPSRRFSPWFLIVNAGTALIVTHILVLDSGNLPIYLAASLTSVYSTQLCFIRLREWLITVAIVFGWYILASLQRGEFATPQGWVAPLFYAANYTIATALIGVRARIGYREMQGRLALQQRNEELRIATEQLQSELILARNIQQSLLPPPVLAWPRLDVVCYSQPAREVGGDFYSYYYFDDGRVGVAVGDVSGKGVSAALLMATSLSLFNSQVVRHLAPAHFVAELDRSLVPYTQPRGQNCALCYLELDDTTCTIVNAGAIPPYILHPGGEIEWPDVRGFALGHGLGAETGYRGKQVAIAPDDMIIITSDGVVEAKNGRGQMFGFDRLEQAISAGPAGDAQAMVDHLGDKLRDFVGATEAHDDLTLVVARVHDLRQRPRPAGQYADAIRYDAGL